MRVVFADTHYWVALINSRDQWHTQAVSLKKALATTRLVTTDSILTELANFFAEYGSVMRHKVALTIRAVLDDEDIEVIPESRQSFLAGAALYESRLDKGYSLTDCVSMNLMTLRGIVDVLSPDAHFAQEGFNPLL
jgi:predicted nucleic acid-binding protein